MIAGSERFLFPVFIAAHLSILRLVTLRLTPRQRRHIEAVEHAGDRRATGAAPAIPPDSTPIVSADDGCPQPAGRTNSVIRINIVDEPHEQLARKHYDGFGRASGE